MILACTSVGAQALAVTGRVLDMQGKPVAGSSVHLLLNADDVAWTETGAQGEYRFDGLIPGSYLLRAESPDLAAATRGFTVAEGQPSVPT